MRRFEKRDRNGAEIFWQIERSGRTVDRSWGQLGGVCQFTTNTYASEAEAQVVFGQRAKTMLARGYVETTPRQVERRSAMELDALETLVLADPDDPDVYQVVADSLHQQGDPRGELSSLQLEMDAMRGLKLTPDDQALLNRLGKLSRLEHAVMTEHRSFLLGPLVRLVRSPGVQHRAGVTVRQIQLTWRWGWIHTLSSLHPVVETGELVRRIQRAPAARFLRELHLGRFADPLELQGLPATCTTVEMPEPG